MNADDGLWSHQKLAIEMAGREFARGRHSVCVVMSTGAGKTRTGGVMCRRHLIKKPEGKILWIAHREELVGQAFDDLTALGLECGVIQANPTRVYNPFRNVQVASVQTMLARGLIPDASMAVLDEFHHYASDKWAALAMEYRKRRIPIIGLTATPIRGDGRGFEGIMDALVVPITMKELIEQGFLVPFTLHAPEKPLRNDQIAMKPVDAYMKYASGRKAIVFSGNIPAARAHCEEFRAAGVTCEVVWGDMDAGDRRRVLEDYKNGRVQVLTNVGVLTEGFDDKPTSCVILARSVGPLALYLQMCGRGLRISIETGKVDAVIIDLHGSCRIHGPPDADREWALEGDGLKKKPNEQPTQRFCRVCKVTLEPGMDGLVCEFCQIARPEAVPPSVVNAKLVKYEHLQADPPSVRRARFERLKQKGIAKGASPWQAVVIYEKLYGERPPREWIFRKVDEEDAGAAQ